VIRSWANSATRKFAEDGKNKFSGMDEEAAIELLATLDAATSLRDLSPLKSVGLHKLSRDREGQWAMTINGPWRICFRFEDGDAWDVEIVDYH
jgi:proteic killer suppression protein